VDVELTPKRASQHGRDRRRRVHTRTQTIEWSRVKSSQKTRLRVASGNQQATTETTLEREVRLTGVRTEARVSARSDRDTGEAGDGRSDAPMAVAMEKALATAVTPLAAETAGETIVEPMQRNKNGKRRSRSEAQAIAVAPSDWRSHMERTMRQQVQELTQLRRTVSHLTNQLEAQAAHEEALWREMMLWMQEREQKWDTRHEDKRLWVAGITDIITKFMKGVAPGQEAREEGRDKTARMNGGWLEASQHADTMQEGGPEKHQQLQQQPKPRLKLKLQPKPLYEPKPKSAPTPTPAGR